MHTPLRWYANDGGLIRRCISHVVKGWPYMYVCALVAVTRLSRAHTGGRLRVACKMRCHYASMQRERNDWMCA